MPLLLHMGEPQLALERAISSGDTELLHLVLLHAKDNLPPEPFFALLAPPAAAEALPLLIRYAASRDARLLKDFYFYRDQPLPAAGLAVREGYRAEGLAQRLDGLKIAHGFYQANEAARDGGAQCAMLAQATTEQIELLQAQRQLEADTQGKLPAGAWRFVDTPLNETLHRCFCYGQTAAAERLRAEFHVPDKRWWRLKTRGLAHAHAWGALWDFSNAKRSPVGLGPFMEACVAQGAREEAVRYAQRMPATEAVPELLKLAEPDAARRVAVQHKEKQPQLLRAVSTYVMEQERSMIDGQ